MSENPNSVPGTAQDDRKIRILKVVVIGLGILIIIGFIALAVGLVYSGANTDDKGEDTKAISASIHAAPLPVDMSASFASSLSLALPPGATVISTGLDGIRLSVRFSLEDETGQYVWIYDLTSGALLSKIQLNRE